jgi:hypothetical protein
MRSTDQFHTGIVVEDLDAALDELGAAFGYEWGHELDVGTDVQLPDRVITVQFRFRYSRTTPRIEVIQARPDTPWTRVEVSGVHHLGYWSDDVAADMAALQEAGYAFEAGAHSPDGPPGWAYCRHPHGLRIELVSRAMEPLLSQLWA